MLCTHQKTAIVRMVDPQLLYSHCCGHQNLQVARNQSIDITIDIAINPTVYCILEWCLPT